MELDVIKSSGICSYSDALVEQRRLHDLRTNNRIADTLWILEHEPVITTGIRGGQEDFIRNVPDYVNVVATKRGGQVTYHGPGQMMGYLFIAIENHGFRIRDFVRNVEQAFIVYLADFWDIEARHDDDYTGVWVGQDKIAAIGIALKDRVTFHGFAFNVDTDLSHFSWIVPCGIEDSERGITSLSKILGRSVSLYDLADDFADVFRKVLGYSSLF